MKDTAIGKGLCYTEFLGKAHLWDSFLDAGKNKRAERPAERNLRIIQAAEICQRCPEREECDFEVLMPDPLN